MTFEQFIAPFDRPRKTGKGVLVRCPAHDDDPKTPSLSVSPANDGGVLLKCFAGCTAPQIVGSLGLTMRDLFAKERAVKFTLPPARAESKKPDQPDVKPVIEKIYSYRDANGREVCQAIRMKPKSFRQRHRNPEFDNCPPEDRVGVKEWLWTMDGVERVLYRLPQVLATQTVWLTEGEKDVDNLVTLGFEATTNIGGSKSWLDTYAESLAGKDVVICGDNDKAGAGYVDTVFAAVSATAKSVRIVKLPDSVKDVSDYIASFKTPDEAKSALHDLVAQSCPTIKGHNLPVYSLAEIEFDYRRFVRAMGENSYSLGRWLPTLGINLRPLVPGELVFFIGDTGTGKTAILAQIAKSAQPLATLMFELELPKELMFERFVSMAIQQTGAEVEKNYQSYDGDSSEDIARVFPKLLICPSSRITTKQMEEIILRSELKMGERPKLVLIDYIQLVGGGGESRRERISDIAEELKIIAKATRTIIIVTSQISRPKDVDEKWEPSLHSAKESGSIEASCGMLISAWRDLKDGTALNLRVLKSTKGGTGTFVKCNFDGARMIITERSKFQE